MANPVHALHLASHLESDGVRATGDSLSSSRPAHQRRTGVEPALYGEEQCRTNALVSSGITHTYCELIATDTHEEDKYVTRPLLPQPHAGASLQQVTHRSFRAGKCKSIAASSVGATDQT
jgi:hypothetical protein